MPQLPSLNRSKGAYINYTRKMFGFLDPLPLVCKFNSTSLNALYKYYYVRF